MPPETSELRALAETAFRSLNSGDIDGFLALVADDVEFTSMILELENVTFRGLTWWASFRSEAEALAALELR